MILHGISSYNIIIILSFTWRFLKENGLRLAVGLLLLLVLTLTRNSIIISSISPFHPHPQVHFIFHVTFIIMRGWVSSWTVLCSKSTLILSREPLPEASLDWHFLFGWALAPTCRSLWTSSCPHHWLAAMPQQTAPMSWQLIWQWLLLLSWLRRKGPTVRLTPDSCKQALVPSLGIKMR